MEFTNPYDIAILPAIVGIVELLKRLGMSSKWAPLASVALGLISGYFYVAPGNLTQAILSGIGLGLAAVGLWSGPKNTAEGLRMLAAKR